MRRSASALGLSMWLVLSLAAPSIGADEPSPAPAVPDPELVAIGRFIDPVLGVDPDGHRHIVAITRVDGPEVGGDLWYATDRSGAWVARQLLVGQGCEASWGEPDMAIDVDGSVHVVVVDGRPCDTPSVPDGIHYLTDAGRDSGDFSGPIRIVGARMSDPALVVADGVRYLAYSRAALPGEQDSPAFLRVDPSGQWAVERIADQADDVALQVDASGRIHLVYRDVSGFDRRPLLYTMSRPWHEGLAPPARIPRSRGAMDPSLAVDAAGRAQATWLTGAAPFVAWSERTDDGWSRPLRPGQGRHHFLGVDDAGRSHLIFERALDGERVVLHAVRDGDAWTEGILARGDARGGLDGAVHGTESLAAWTPPDGYGLWASAAGIPSDAAALTTVAALDDLTSSLSSVYGCTRFSEEGANDPFTFGAIAAIECDRPAGGVRQLALFRFPDAASMDDYWA
ncbi:MAG: hypothetical protein AB1Z63_13605, partial [Candidatus Limnocylindrales bacterium]